MSEDRECTCHPDEAPVPCRKKYAFTECENEQLREENARYKLTYAKYVEAADRMNGTPCEQIRHQQEVEALREENARLQAQRKKDKRLNHETESGLLEENVRLREENTRLREALKPFASINFNACLEDADSGQLWGWFSREDVRAAAAAIREHR